MPSRGLGLCVVYRSRVNGTEQEDRMYLKQFVRDESGCASYLVGSLRDGCCAVVDPQWVVEPYLQAAAAKGLRITHVLETHLHADHVSGARRLAAQTGA